MEITKRIVPYVTATILVGVSLTLITFPGIQTFIPKTSKTPPWLFQVISFWGEQQANLAWHRGGPEEKPQGSLNLQKYHAEQSLALAAQKLRPMANYKLASAWLRFSLALNNENIENWRLAGFLAGLAGDYKKAQKYLKAALDRFPNHPLLLLEKVVVLGEKQPPLIHLEWAKQAYYRFITIPYKPALTMMDIRSFYFQYINALEREDRELKKPGNRQTAIRLYNELAVLEPIALERSPLYKRLVKEEQEYQAKLKSTPKK